MCAMWSPNTHVVRRPDGAELSVSTQGTGPVVLLISGLGATAAFWRPVVDALAAQFTLVTFDQRGIGASGRGDVPVTIDALADDALGVLERLGVARYHVVGHSTGGCIAMSLAARTRARLDALVLSATWIRATPYMSALFAARRATLMADADAYASLGAMLGYPPDWLEANWGVHEAAVRNAPHSAVARAVVADRIAALLAFDGRPLLAHLGARCLVVGARDDLIVPHSAQRELHAALSGSEFFELETGGHFFPVTRTEAFSARVASFAGSKR